jgi:hypothetical protein
MRLLLLLSLALLLAPQKQATNEHKTQQQVSTGQVQPPELAQESSKSPRTPITEFYTYNTQQKNEPEAAKIVFDGLLVLANIGLIWVGLRQANILHKHEEWMQKHDENLRNLAESAKDNAIAVRDGVRLQLESLRPRLAIGARTSPFGEMIQGKKLIIDVEFVNTGGMPAYAVQPETWIEFLDIPFTGFTSNSVHQTGSSVTVHPHQPSPFRIPFGRALTSEEIGRLKSVKATLHLRVRLNYEVFGQQKHTDYTFQITPTTMNIENGDSN